MKNQFSGHTANIFSYLLRRKGAQSAMKTITRNAFYRRRYREC